MPLILDTFNILHTVGVLPPDLAGIDIPGLATLILRSRYRSERIILACDGMPAPDLPLPGRLTSDSADPDMVVQYSGRGRSADDLIRDLINASSAPRRLIVVSSDHAVQRHARRRRCVALTSHEFLQHLADDASLPRPGKPARTIPAAMTAEQVDRWLDVFAVDEEALTIESSTDDLPSTSLNQAGPKRSDGPGQPQTNPTAIQPDVAEEPAAPSPADMLPPDLIADAEALYAREQATASPANPATNAPKGADPTADDYSDLDMNSILPADGRTKPLRKRSNRHRRP